MLKIRFTFSRQVHIRKKAHFQYVYTHSKKIENAYLKIYYAKAANLGKGCVAFIASKKVGGAVVRNKCRRWFREIYRLSQHEINKEYDLILMAKDKLVNLQYKQAYQEVRKLLKAADLLNLVEQE